MPSKHVRLNPQFKARLDANPRLWPVARKLIAFFKDEKFRGSMEHQYKRLKNRKIVERKYGVAFVRYLREKKGMQDVTEEIALNDAQPLGIFDGPKALFDALVQPFRSDPRMFLGSDEVGDSWLASGMMLDTLGYKIAGKDDPLDEESCIQRGEKDLRMSRREYARWIREIRQKDGLGNSVMFYLHKGKRVGASVTLPLKQTVWEEIAAGLRHDMNLTGDDLEPYSRYLYVHMLSDAEREEKLSVRQKTLIQAWCHLFQIAYFMRRIRPFRPALLTLFTNEHHEAMLIENGWRPNGNILYEYGHPLMVYRHPREFGRCTTNDSIRFRFHKFIVEVFQISNYKEWRDQDVEWGFRKPREKRRKAENGKGRDAGI